MAKKKAKGNSGLKTYKSYVFREKEPVIDESRTFIEDMTGEKLNRRILVEIEKNGGPTASTMANWFFGTTKRPQNATVEAMGRSFGYRRKWVKMT